ncbi:MAG TPA: bifunctional phosphoglucose/phosphomannose isomerase [Chitinophagales bacterium]|nr:bifunctional phosphoglucose/phosphomannose isomerase [Chitinophagales bacterium]
MDKLISSFTSQLAEAMKIGRAAELTPQHHDIRNVVVAGLGGSGIGGNLVEELTRGKMKVPMTICKDYHLPEFVNEHTLLIVSSYSGNTEETLHALQEGMNRMAKIVCITSGGSLERIARKAGLDVILIPGGMPPRAMLAYSFVQQLYVLFHYRYIDLGFEVGIDGAITLIDREVKKIQKQAKSIAKKLNKKIPVIYANASQEAVAIRWRQQLNENSKTLAWHHVIPEMNHNELVGWRTKGKWGVVMLRNETDYERNVARFNIAKGIIQPYTKTIIEVMSKGDNEIERSLYLIHLGDWVSVYLAELRQVDPVEVKVIDHLKAELAN